MSQKPDITGGITALGEAGQGDGRENHTPGLLDTWGRRNRRLTDIPCGTCGAVFRPVKATAKYCSLPCARKKNGGHNIKYQTWWTNGRGYIEGRVLTAQGHRRVKQHRFVMECAIGRLLRRDEDVHHKDGNKANNDIGNLELLDHGDHTREHCFKREYRRGYKLELTAAERAARADRMRLNRATIAKARGE